MKKAFTLAEIMIVFVVIGVLAGITVPIAIQSSPDENVMKFKKANTTLAQVIRELVTSDKYYCNGDLGIKADCKTWLVNADATRTYFCEAIADLLTTKKVNCCNISVSGGGILLSNEKIGHIATGEPMKRPVTPEKIQATKEFLDIECKRNAQKIGQEIVTSDNIVYYNASTLGFASNEIDPDSQNGLEEIINLRHFSPPNQFPANYADESGFDISYKIYCIDIDGFDETKGSASCDDKKDICPFGYGIRADGKILPGARTDEWFEKSIQKGKDD